MNENNIELNLFAYSELIKLCKFNNNKDEALRLYNELKTKNIEPDELTLTNLLTVCKDDLPLTLQLFHEFEEEKTIRSYTCVLKCLALNTDLDTVAFYEKMKSNVGTDDFSISVLANAFALNGNIENTKKLFKNHRNSINFSCLLKSYDKNNLFDNPDVRELLLQNEDLCFKPDVIKTVFSILLRK
eukprot:UN24450